MLHALILSMSLSAPQATYVYSFLNHRNVDAEVAAHIRDAGLQVQHVRVRHLNVYKGGPCRLFIWQCDRAVIWHYTRSTVADLRGTRDGTEGGRAFPIYVER